MRAPHRIAAACAAAAVLSIVTRAQTPMPLVEEGDAVPGVGNVTSIQNLAINNDMTWLVEADTDNPSTDDDFVVIRDGALYLQEGQALAAPSGASLDTFDTISVDNNGNSVWNFFLSGTTGTSDDSGIYSGSDLVLQEGTFSGAPEFSANTPYIGFFETKQNDNDKVLVMASVDDPAIASTVDRALVLWTLSGSTLVSETVVAKEGDVLAGQSEAVADFRTGPHEFALNDSDDVLFVADLTGDTAVDLVVYLNSTILAQEGGASPVGGRNWLSLASAKVDLNDNGDTVFVGSLDGDAATNTLIVKNGAKFVQEGDSLAAIGGFGFTSFGSGPLLISDGGDVFWFGDWDDPDTTVDTGLFMNDQLLVQEGVTTVGGVVIDELRGIQDGFTISDDGRFLVFEALLASGIEGAYLVCTVPATSAVRNGSGANPLLLSELTPAALGTNWQTAVDIVTPGGSASVLALGLAPLAGFPLNGFVQGELLCLPPLSTNVSAGTHSIAVPLECRLAGLSICAQGGVFVGGHIVLTNALDVVLGN